VQRDLGIDLIRGVGILMIAVDHLAGVVVRLELPGTVNPFLSWTRLGWSSAAEFFVFFSGYLIGVVYLQTLRQRGLGMTYARAVHRCWQIYAANVLTLCVVLLLLHDGVFANPQLERFVSLSALGEGDASVGLVRFLALQSAPTFFEILQLYVIFLLVAPLVLLVARRSAVAVMAGSVALWLAVQFDPSFNLSRWNFNPYAWQLVFVLGMVVGMGGWFGKLRAMTFRWTSRRALLIGTGALLSIALLIKIGDKGDWHWPLLGPLHVAGIDKTSLGVLRLLHFLVSVLFVIQLLPSSERLQRWLPARAVATVGRFSLESFCFSTVLVYACIGLLLNSVGVGAFALLSAGGVVVLLVCGFAAAMHWLRGQPWRDTASRDAVPRAAPPSNDAVARDTHAGRPTPGPGYLPSVATSRNMP
jgi:hypothetical protein